jgi:fucose 4-O-acetylase-like acetyltransferase
MGRRLAWIEAARTLCSFLVVLAHVDIYTRAGVETWWPGGFYSVPVLSLAVPSFFIIAGYAVDMGTGHASRSAILSRVRRLVIPFLAWNVITLLVLAEPGQNIAYKVFQIATGTWHLYFIFALLQLLVLHALLFPAIESGQIRTIVITAVALTITSYVVSEALLWLNGADNGTAEVLHRKLFTFWAGFFAVGVWWRRRGSRRLSPFGWIATAFVIAAAYAIYIFDLKLEVSSFGFTPRKQLLVGGLAFQLLASATMLVLIEKLDGTKFVTALAPWGRDSYGIYLVHISVMLLLFRFLLSNGWLKISWYQVPVLTVATYLISLAFVRAVRATHIAPLKLVLLGESNK